MNYSRAFQTVTLSIVFTAAIALMSIPVAHAFKLFGNSHEDVTPESGVVSIPVQDVDDGDIHYYKYTRDGHDVRFFLLQSNDGIIRAAFDACDVCYEAKKGYSLEGDFAVCNNCGMRFHSSRINVVQGGCNPAPLHRVTENGIVKIKVTDITQGARFF